nr:3599_t:CDS:2 [Entrophospora candida]
MLLYKIERVCDSQLLSLYKVFNQQLFIGKIEKELKKRLEKAGEKLERLNNLKKESMELDSRARREEKKKFGEDKEDLEEEIDELEGEAREG